MSNFAGVTFAEQKVTPSYDAVVRRAGLTDGILSGCLLSYSGSTLTMAAGSLLAAGRQIHHTAASNWAVVDATSGYARLVLTIDLTQAATKDSFEQISAEIQYASSVNGFSSLTQNDINGTGTKYQVAVCVVSLGTGGISGIVSSLPSSVARAKDAVYARASGSASALSLPKNQITQLTLDTWNQRSSEDFNFSGGGIVMPKDGTVMIVASVYFNFATVASPGTFGPYVKLNGNEIAGLLSYSQSQTAVQLAPIVASVAAGDVLSLHARSTTTDGSCVPNAKMTGLTVIYL